MKTIKDQFIELNNERRLTIPTSEAAFHLNRKPQTLRTWACFENGPIMSTRVHGRLAWFVEDIKKIIQGDNV